MEHLHYSIPAKVYAITMLICGITLRHYVKSRRLGRINKEGVSEFSTYGHKVILTGLEKLLMFMGRLLLLFGLLLLGADYINHKD